LLVLLPTQQEFFTGEKWQLLTPLGEKVEVLENLGVKQLVLLPFSAQLASLTPWLLSNRF
jgi:riboflavin kinase/FMN adenylyltransferase